MKRIEEYLSEEYKNDWHLKESMKIFANDIKNEVFEIAFEMIKEHLKYILDSGIRK